jgi:hypothetical protein
MRYESLIDENEIMEQLVCLGMQSDTLPSWENLDQQGGAEEEQSQEIED